MSIRLNLTSPTEEARAELARLQRAQSAMYLGASVWLWVWLAIGSAVVGLALSAAGILRGPDPDSLLLAECARTNGAALTVAECSGYLDWLAATAVCSELEEQSDWASCVEAVEAGWECGAVLEEGVWLEASCETEEELEERLEQIRASRSGDRDWEDGL